MAPLLAPSAAAPVRPIDAPSPSVDRLDSWKAIAAYLGREVRTVQRWERKEALLVHRHFHSRGSSVYAFKHEIDTWLLNRRALAAVTVPATRRAASRADSLRTGLFDLGLC
jgi:hypothetical protein